MTPGGRWPSWGQRREVSPLVLRNTHPLSPHAFFQKSPLPPAPTCLCCCQPVRAVSGSSSSSSSSSSASASASASASSASSSSSSSLFLPHLLCSSSSSLGLLFLLSLLFPYLASYCLFFLWPSLPMTPASQPLPMLLASLTLFQQAGRHCLSASASPSCSLSLPSRPEGPLNQGDKPNTFLLALPTGLKVPGRQANYSLPYQPSAPRHPTNHLLLRISAQNREAQQHTEHCLYNQAATSSQ